jgi:hypothetical protein
MGWELEREREAREGIYTFCHHPQANNPMDPFSNSSALDEIGKCMYFTPQ